MLSPSKLLVAVALAAAAARGSAAGLAPGRHEVELDLAGLARSFRVIVPALPAPAGGFPLVVAFHGSGGSAHSMEEMTRLHELGEAAGFVTVYARGTGADAHHALTWNAGRCCGYAREHGVDDVAYARALLDRVAELVPVAPGRVYLAGFSNGAMLVYRLAAELGARVAAIGAVGAPPDPDLRWAPGSRVSVIHFQGTADRYVPYRGGLSGAPGGSTWLPPVRTALRELARLDGLSAEPRRDELPDRTDDGTTVRREAWGPGADGAEVVLYTIEGGTHSWPGGPDYLVDELGKPSRELDACRLMWEFFARHAR